MIAVKENNNFLMCVCEGAFMVYFRSIVHVYVVLRSLKIKQTKTLKICSVFYSPIGFQQVTSPQTNLLTRENALICLWTLPPCRSFQSLKGFLLGNLTFSQVMKVAIFSSKVLLWREAVLCYCLCWAFVIPSIMEEVYKKQTRN